MVLKFLIIFVRFLCLLIYLRMDPIKSRFFLVLGLLLTAPIISFNIHIWYSYYVCLLFLRGVFVIVVYFSSLSKFEYMKRSFGLFSGLLIFLVGRDFFLVGDYFLSINNFYYVVYLGFVFIVIFILLFFMNFIRYFLSLAVAMRRA